jgi:hypothetical protein
MRSTVREMQRHADEVVKRALDLEYKARKDAFATLQAQGHVTVMQDDDPLNIRVRVDEEYFAEPRTDWPSTLLMAKLQLSIAAGNSDRNSPPYEGAYTGRWNSRAIMEEHYPLQKSDAVWYDEMNDFKLYERAAVTATVKPRKMKGLRP